MEQKRLEVILEARDRASAALNSFGRHLGQAVNQAQHAAAKISQSFSKIQGAGGGGFGGIGAGLTGALSGAMGMVGRLGGVFLSVGSSILGVLGNVIGKVVEVGAAFVSHLAGFAVDAIKKTALALTGLAVGATAAVAALGIIFLKAAGQMERYQSQFTVLTGSAEKAKALLIDLRKFAETTPFELPEVIDAARLMMAFQLVDALGGIREGLSIVGDTAQAMGIPMEQAILTLSKLKAGMFDMGEMARTGITRPAMEAQGIKFTKSGEPEDRNALFPAGLAIFSKFAGTMSSQSANLELRLSNLSDAWFKLKTAIGAAFMPAAKDAINAFIGIIDKVTAFVSGNENLQASINRMGQFVGGVFSKLEERIGGWLDWLSENWDSVWQTVTEKVQWAAGGIAYGIGYVIGVVQELWASKDQIWDWAKEFIKAVGAIAQTIQGALIEKINALAEWMGTRKIKVLGLEIDYGNFLAAAGGAVAGGVVGSAFGPAGTAIGATAGFMGAGKAYRSTREFLSTQGERMAAEGQLIPQKLVDKLSDIAKELKGSEAAGFLSDMNAAGKSKGDAFVQALQELANNWGQVTGGAGGALGMTALGNGAWQLPIEQGVEKVADSFDTLNDVTDILSDRIASANKAFDDYTESMIAQSRGELVAGIFGAYDMPEQQKAALEYALSGSQQRAEEARLAFAQDPTSMGGLKEWSEAVKDEASIRKELKSLGNGAPSMPDWAKKAAGGITINTGPVNDKAGLLRTVQNAVAAWWDGQVSLEASAQGFADGY